VRGEEVDAGAEEVSDRPGEDGVAVADEAGVRATVGVPGVEVDAAAEESLEDGADEVSDGAGVRATVGVLGEDVGAGVRATVGVPGEGADAAGVRATSALLGAAVSGAAGLRAIVWRVDDAGEGAPVSAGAGVRATLADAAETGDDGVSGAAGVRATVEDAEVSGAGVGPPGDELASAGAAGVRAITGPLDDVVGAGEPAPASAGPDGAAGGASEPDSLGAAAVRETEGVGGRVASRRATVGVAGADDSFASAGVRATEAAGTSAGGRAERR